MALSRQSFVSLVLLVLTTFSSLVAAQGVLSSGNSQLPACALQCALLNQASQACGGSTAVTTTVWNCFCQSGYLTSLYNSPNGICDTTCTSASDNQAVMNWYKSNCGTDHGASEHSGNNAAAPSASPSTSASAAATPSAVSPGTGSSPNTGTTVTGNSSSDSSTTQKRWVDTHYRWIIFLVVVAVGFAIVIVVAIWLKRRHERKRDQIKGGFNAGVSERAPPAPPPLPPMRNATFNQSGDVAGTSGAHSPARTREAFMPYGYNYSRSETRVAEADRRSPLPRDHSPMDDMEKGAGTPVNDPDAIQSAKRTKRVLVRERPPRAS